MKRVVLVAILVLSGCQQQASLAPSLQALETEREFGSPVPPPPEREFGFRVPPPPEREFGFRVPPPPEREFGSRVPPPPGADEVPLKRRGNEYTVPVVINETITLPFVLDTGATVLVIPKDVAYRLLREGALSTGDFIGKTSYALATGSVVTADQINIREAEGGPARC